MANEPNLDGYEIFSPSQKAEAAAKAAEQFAAEGVEVQLSADGSLQVSLPSLKAWLDRQLQKRRSRDPQRPEFLSSRP